MAGRLSGKVCIITGTGGGMGREAARIFYPYVTGVDIVVDGGMRAW